MRPATVLELSPPQRGARSRRPIWTSSTGYGSLDEFLAVFWLVQSCL